jgi:hypothetical protein
MVWKSIQIFLAYAVIFIILSLPITYSLSNKIGLKTLSSEYQPNLRGIFTHAFIFSIIICILMITYFRDNNKIEDKENKKKRNKK